MSDNLIKKDWIERAKLTFRFHRSKLLSTDKWTASLTAKALNRSISSVTEDLKIARWLRTHSKELEKFKYASEALSFIKEKEKKMDLEDID